VVGEVSHKLFGLGLASNLDPPGLSLSSS
jgi:hypothetical protein